MRITCYPILKTPSPSTECLVKYSLYNSNRIRDKWHPCLAHFPLFTILASSSSSPNVILRSTQNLLINLLSRQSTSPPFRICINLNYLTRPNAFCQSVRQALNFSSMSKVRSDTILSIQIAYLLPFSLLNPNWSSPSRSSILFQSFF